MGKEKDIKHQAKMDKKQKAKDTNRRQIRWDKLDNTAHIFPVIAGEGLTNTYRICVELNEEIQPSLLLHRES